MNTTNHDISGRSWVVTQHDIEHGRTHDCRHCPHALAIKRTFGECKVGSMQVELSRSRFMLRLETRAWISRFDYSFQVKPGLHCEMPKVTR